MHIEGERIRVTVNEAGKVIHQSLKAGRGSKDSKTDTKQTVLPFKPSESAASSSKMKPPTATGKSIWKGRDDDEVTVEILSLQHYEKDGYKG